MFAHHLRQIKWFWLILVALMAAGPAQAQTAARVELYPPETDNFPTIVTYLDVRGEQGHFLPGLGVGDVRILEDSLSRPVDQLAELQPGAQFVLAVASGATFNIRDTSGSSRYSLVAKALETWANALPSPLQDDLSLITPASQQVVHTASVSEWLSALQSFQPEAQRSNSQSPQSNLQSLSLAIDIADDASPRLGMGRAVLFITAPQPAEVEAGLRNLTERARQQGIRLFCWFISSPDLFVSPSAVMFEEAAIQTGGEFFAFSRDEAIPDLETYLEPLRHIYQITYTSRILSSGTHELAAEVNTPALQMISPSRQFELAVSPPNPIFVSPPLLITRTEVEVADQKGQVLTALGPKPLTPETQALEILIEFPDNHPRPVLTTTLYVDGLVVLQNTEPPLEKFAWDLSAYEQSGSHKVRVTVVDSLGLTGATIEVPVQIEVQRSKVEMWTVISQQGALVVVVMIVLAGGVLGLVLVLGGRIRPRVYGKQPNAGRKRKNEKKQPLQVDPLLQPLTPHLESSSRRPGWLHWPQRHTAPTALAFLTPISEGETPHGPPIPLGGEEVTLGSSPAHAQVVLDEPSIANLHTRLRFQENCFMVYDEGSIAGTWLNYEIVCPSGASLTHGDIVHIGRLGFRFTLRQPKQTRKPIIQKELPG